MAKGIDTGRGEGWPLMQTTPKIKAFHLGIMEKTILFMCQIMVLISLHTLKNALIKGYRFFSKKKNQRQVLSAKINKERKLWLKSYKFKFEATKIFTSSYFKGQSTEQGSLMEENLLFIGKVTVGTNMFSLCQGS